MQTELYSLSKIFTETLLRIPDYQRGYSWQAKHLKDFWEDISLLDGRRDHYTGVLTLEDVSEEIYSAWSDDGWIIESKRYRPYYVVDGQQRLTTALILLQCILERSGPGTQLNYSTVEEIRKKYIFESRDGGISRSYVFGYEKDNPSYEYLKTCIFMEASDSHNIGEQTIYTQNLETAKTFFAEKLASLEHPALEDTFAKLTQRFMFNIYVISKEIDVFVAFETMNNRGKLLSHLELLKNRLIFLSTRLGVDNVEKSKLRRTINDSWKTTYHFLGRNKKRPLDDDDFLATQFLLYMGAREAVPPTAASAERRVLQVRRMRFHDQGYQSILLDGYFTAKNLGPENGTTEPSYPRLTPEMLFDYAHDLKRCVETYYRLYNPSDSNFTDGSRVHLERIRRLGWRNAIPLAVAVVHCKPAADELCEFFERLERMLFVQSVKMDRGFVHSLPLLAVKLAHKEETVGEISQKIHNVTEKQVKDIVLTDSSMNASKSQTYYAWGTLRYFMFEYEQELKLQAKANRDKLIWEEFTQEDFESDFSTIEHIYPQEARHSYWKDRFAGFTPHQRNLLKNSLGNLVPLSRPKNSALSNRPFPEKRDGGDHLAGYRVGSYSEIAISSESEWTPNSILERGILLLDFLERRWGIPTGDRRQKIAALRLGFLTGQTSAEDESDSEGEDSEVLSAEA